MNGSLARRSSWLEMVVKSMVYSVRAYLIHLRLNRAAY
jgi:hypothetical protein